MRTENDMSKILTVAIPSYNVEKFLKTTLDSFLCEESVMEKIEVIVVDDGSKDGTAAIGKEYEAKYPHTFRTISKENGGHGSAVNCGIENASGKYYKIVDGDDWVNTEDFVKLVSLLEKCDSEYVFTNYYEYYDDVKRKNPVKYRRFKNGESYTFADFADDFHIPMHALIIRTDILKDNRIKLDEKCFYVDTEYIAFPVPYVKSITYFDLYVYMYRLNLSTQSVSVTGYQRHIDDHIRVTLRLIDFYNEYSSSPEKDEYKNAYIKKLATKTTLSQSRIFSSFPYRDMENRKRFAEFDAELKKRSPEIYEATSARSKKLALLRKYNFRHYSLIQFLSKLRNGSK